jgi:hypothetical protein
MGISFVLSFSSLAGRVALFVMGHVVVLGLVAVLSMSAGRAGPDVAGAPAETVVTGSVHH